MVATSSKQASSVDEVVGLLNILSTSLSNITCEPVSPAASARERGTLKIGLGSAPRLARTEGPAR